jgi:beta-lactamase regulating signal transducer with metallopeptidase domain
MSEAILLSYLKANVFLALGYLFFRLGHGWTRGRGGLRWAQSLLLLSILSPFLVSLVPARPLPSAAEEILAPLAEVGEAVKSHVSKSSEAPPVSAVAPAPARSKPDPAAAALALLVSIVAALGLRLARSQGQLMGRLEAALPLRRCGRVRIVACERTSVPFSARVAGQAWVVVPEKLLGNWSDFKIAVRHELQHHRQGDTSWALAAEWLTALFFANPAIYLWKRRISELQELSCDESLIGRKVSARDYGSCLVRVAEAALGGRPGLIGTVSMAAGSKNPAYFKSFLRRRIEMFSHENPRPSRVALTATGLLMAGATLAVAYGTQVKVSEPPSAEIAPGLVETDPGIQRIAERAIRAAIKRHRASLGFVVVGDPATGRILAVANEDLVEKEAPRTPHWALSLKVGPASIAKAIVTAAALENGVTTPSEVHNCEKGSYLLGGKLYRDWKAFDTLTTADTVAQSSNICGIKVGQKLGAKALDRAFRDFGFGPGGTAQGFPEARPGDMPDSAQDEHFVAQIATGYSGIFVSPVEVVQAFGAIANGGMLMKPLNGAGTPQSLRRVLSAKAASEMKRILAEVMVSGTALKSASSLYKLAGKTATGYSRTHVGHDTLGGDSNMASFVGFGPVDNPRVVIYVVVENPTDMKGVHGSSHAAPVFKEVAEKSLQYLGVR